MKRTISVVGSATVAVVPDLARLTCGVHTTGVNAHDALRRCNESIQAIVDALRTSGVDGADLRTGGPSLFRAERGYQGSSDVTVTVRRIESLGSVIDAVAAAGGPNFTMHGVTFSVADPAPHLSAARRAAMAAAHAIATELAAAGGAGVGEVITINESSGYQAPVMAYAAEMRMAKATPIEAGEQQLRVDVNVTYRLIDA